MGKNLTLTGMMGAGKSTIGKILAKKLKYRFIDVDKNIEQSSPKMLNSALASGSICIELEGSPYRQSL